MKTMKMLDAAEVDRRMIFAAKITMALWVTLVYSVYRFIPEDKWERLSGARREVPFMASIALIVIMTIFAIPFINLGSLRNQDKPSGVVIAGFCVITISISTNLLLTFAPTPIVRDPVTGVLCFVVRWCEWIPLSFLMTYMSEAVDHSDRNEVISGEVFNSLLQLVSTVCGLIFPLCQDIQTWSFVCTISMVTYLNMFYRLHKKFDMLRNEPKGVTVIEKENYNRRYFAASLLQVCSLIWTVLVVLFMVNAACHLLLPESHLFYSYNDSISMICDTIFDVVAKGFYLNVILNVHKTVFDSDARVERQFEELRKLMKVLWDSTSDVIIISVRGRERASSVISPSYLALLGIDTSAISPDGQTPGILLQSSNDFSYSSQTEVLDANYIDSHHMAPSGMFDKSLEPIAPVPKDSGRIKIAMKLIQSCWNNLNDTERQESVLIVHDFEKKNGDKRSCEIKLSRKPDSFVAIVRDVTERVKRFEAEQRATAEALARQKDAQSVNRFTRHEVKNGLLAGIELCDRLQRSFQSASNHVDDSVSQTLEAKKYKAIESEMIKTAGMIGQVDTVLHEVLETVLAEAMARDVIYESYKPSPKKLDIVDVLRASGGGIGTEARFPLILPSERMPMLMIDGQLLRYIHRNAISNAQKYGKIGGIITTHVFYSEQDQRLRIDVVNEPGEGHDRLVMMGQEASNAVFRPATRLHEEEDRGDGLSSGDGAWIMQKCAKNLGGVCDIVFERHQTKFSVECQAPPVYEKDGGKASIFELPADTWAIGLDDSWIQRKLLLRIFSDAGIHPNRKKVLGRNLSELKSVGLLMGALLDQDPECKLLMLVDENLDFVDENGRRVLKSGSRIMQQVLCKMPSSKSDRVLVLIRSANDSAEDTALYNERTHGFFPKMATKKEEILEILEVVWKARFGSKPKATVSISDEFDNDEGSISKEDLLEVVASVDVLLQGKSFRDVPWCHLWSALHSLKGDILISESEKMAKAVDSINTLRGSEAPENFDEQWTEIRKLIVEGIDDMHGGILLEN